VSDLRRTLNAKDLTLLVVGSVIGSGIFIVPSVVLRQSGGSVPVSLLVWLLGGGLSLLGALSYAELSGMDRRSGGLYAYVQEAFGTFPAFLYGWTLFFVIGAGTIATLAVATTDYMGQFVSLSPLGQKVVAVLLLAATGALNVIGTRESASVQNLAAWAKIGAIVVMSGLLLAMGGSPAMASTSDAGATTLTAVGIAMISVLWAFEGWQYVTFTDAEAIEPQRTIPLALVLGTLALIALYLLANVGYLTAMGADRVAASDRVAAEAVTEVLGPTAGTLIALAIVVSMFSAAHTVVITAPRVYFAMANDGVFFKKLSEVHPRFETPAFAVMTSCAWAMVLAATGTFEQLLTYVVFVGWIFYALGAAAVIALRYKLPDAPRPFRVPWYPLTPAVFILAAVAIVGNQVVSQPLQSAYGLGIVLLGAPAYMIWRRKDGSGGSAAGP
jgi:APA family basic amino acid/polyamine antiporter